jgi:hypothetical protein
MTAEQFYYYLRENAFITKEEWINILQNEDPDILVDYEDEELWAKVT